MCLAAAVGCGTVRVGAQGQSQGASSVVAGPGQTLPGTKVPWKRVGPGWALAQDDLMSDRPSPDPAGSTVLYLIDPRGGRYRLFSWPAKELRRHGTLTAWSADAQRALFITGLTGKHPHEVLQQLDLRTGKATGFTLPGRSLVIGYARPGSGQILAEGNFDSATGTATLIRYDLSGRRQGNIWRAPGLGSVVYSPDGRELVTASYGSLVLLSSAGGLIRHLWSPALCGAVRWWNSATVLASCAAAESDASRMWLIPVSGAKGRALTPPRSGQGADLGDNNLYQLPSGTYLNALGPHCGNSIVVRQEPHGVVKQYEIPGDGDAVIETATSRRLLLQEDPGCSGPFPASLAWYDPVTGRQAIVVPAARGEVGAIAVIPYYQEGQR
jgi:TolB protein